LVIAAAVLVDKRGTASLLGDFHEMENTMNFAFSEEQDELRRSVGAFSTTSRPRPRSAG
jgi:hypothetical protein